MEKINDWWWSDQEITESTNNDAASLSEKMQGEKLIISARQQTAGRGRRGRKWVSLDGNLFFSQALVFDIRLLEQLVKMSSLSLYQTIAAVLPSPHQVSLKWPNDVLIDGSKVSGTLIEKGKAGYIIIGIGVNIKQAPENNGMLYPVTCLYDNGINIDRLAFLRSYIANFDKNYQRWQQGQFPEIKKEWLKAVQGLGSAISVHTEKEDIQGKFIGVGEEGELLLETPTGTRKIFAGDIFI